LNLQIQRDLQIKGNRDKDRRNKESPEMPNIIFTKPDGSEHNVTVENGVTVMEAGRDAGLGIEGTCGGCLSCATCHVIVDADWFAKTGAPGEDEVDMLDLAFGLAQTSRLGCQIEMSDALDGLRVTIPEDM
jgi:2Fe-2S ferredoxin